MVGHDGVNDAQGLRVGFVDALDDVYLLGSAQETGVYGVDIDPNALPGFEIIGQNRGRVVHVPAGKRRVAREKPGWHRADVATGGREHGNGDAERALAVATQVVHGSDVSADQWVYVNFFIANGSEAKNYRLEVWNGSRDNSVKMAADSYVIFDSVSYTTLDETNFNDMLSDSLEALGMDSKFNDTRYATTDEILKAYRENPDAFISENANGASLIYYNFSLFDDKNYTPYDENNDLDTRDSDPYADYDPSSYSDTVAYLRYNGSDNGYIEYNTFVNYGASEIDVATSDSSTDDDTTDDTTGGGTDTNLWLLIPSIILAAALFITLISMLVKKLLGNIRRNKVRTTPQYDARRTRYIRKLKLSEEAEDERDESVPDVLPDEDEIDEEDIYRVEDDTATDEKETDDTDPYADEADDQNNGDDK